MTRSDAQSLSSHLARMRRRLEVAAGHDAVTPVEPDPPSIDEGGPQDRIAFLVRQFDLSTFERDVILITALGELEPDGAHMLAEAQGDLRLRRPTVAFALSVLESAHWGAFAPDGPLRYYSLIELEGEGASARTIALPERVLHHLVGVDTADERLLLLARPTQRPRTLPASAKTVVDDLAWRLYGPESGPPPVIALCGPDASGKAAVAAAAAAEASCAALLIDARAVPASIHDRALLARTLSREAYLSGTLLVIDATDIATPAETHAAAGLAGAVEGPVIIIAPEPITVPDRPLVRVDLPRPLAAEQRDLWSQALGSLAPRLNGTVDRLAMHFSLRPDAISTIGAEARRVAEQTGDERLAAQVWASCRAQGRPKLDELAQRIEGGAGWDDIVLPARHMEVLRMLAAQVRQRAMVYERWGFGRRGVRGLGINALFAGASGTGKTLAAEILGGALELDVYRIDLSAVISKWIGETEKNLRRVFDAAEDGCAILLFDEADALFGKRSEVKDSHDRYANIEVSYLLQRLEAYRGLAILTTNQKSHIDDAFLRRIRFVIDFPYPGPEERREIWRRVFPAETPTAGLDWGSLGQLNVPGGCIRNIAINAAFLAADAGVPVSMREILTSARTEYDKLGRPLTEGERAGWRVEVSRG